MKRAARVLGVVLGIYVFSYVVLSTFGAYAPWSWGFRKPYFVPKWYKWAPAGFYTPATGKWRVTLIIYTPLWAADNSFWHTHRPFPDDTDPQHPAVFLGFDRK